MHNGQGYYHPYHNTPRPNYSSNHNRQPSPSKGSPTNSLLDRISSTPAGSSPTRPSRTSYPPHPRPPVENPAPTQVASPSQENGQEVAAKDVALPSEETVEAFLASVLTTDVVASRLQAPSTSTSASQSSAPPPSTATQSQPSTSTPPSYAPQPASAQIASPPGLLSSTRALLLPHILANARARDPTGAWDDVRSAEAARRARELVTDEWCEEMIAHARRAREEMRKRGVSQEAEVRMDVDVNAGKSVDVQMADNKGKAAEVENQTSNVGAEEMDMSKQEERLRVVEAHGQPPQPLSQLQPRLRLQPQPQFQPQPQLQPQPHLQVQSHPHPQVQSHPHPPGGTMLDGAARVLQNFIANTPRPPSPMSREATDHSTQTAGPSHTAGPSSSAGPASVVHAKSEAASIEGATTAADNESGLWALRVGSRVSEIATITFDMQDSVAPAVQRWARRHTELE
ncbi:uncharacterized protein C8Q71DRAFT_296770 [Rhodofomes roseus]|uniref:Uncharacterized protein n=1 Tax=Rhodofomes roseus TaxID=34475 RepID=A0ABQ8K481_9APHY|nr:uncharacterized protein C8Q71DRAFT_296770 [Rhodofomes roseus]KAH9831645.1 hypothetical protein C8Q71DRAFT_296770 [Rhodofomes roseus]